MWQHLEQFENFPVWGISCYYFLNEVTQTDKYRDWSEYPPVRGILCYNYLEG